MQAYRKDGTALTLAEPPLGQGGEGAVHTVSGCKNVLAKVYSHGADEHQDKIEAMSSVAYKIQTLDVLGNVAWPLAPLYADTRAQRFIGFLMPRINVDLALEDLYEYPAPATVRISLKDKVELLANMAAVVDIFHQMGQVIGDFNNNNLCKVKGSMRIGLMDVDSFHAEIMHTTYRCVVCMPGYMAPELVRNVRNTTFADCAKETFTQATDRFSLAIHIFRMLFNGVHPFHQACIPDNSGSVPAPLPLDKRVERGETPFFTYVSGVRIPKFAPTPDLLPPYLRDLFMRAFVSGHANPADRPTAAEWRRALDRYHNELIRCDSDPAHWYGNGLADCPYCAADARCGNVASGRPAKPPTVAAAAAATTAATARKIAATPQTTQPAGTAVTNSKGSSGVYVKTRPNGTALVASRTAYRAYATATTLGALAVFLLTIIGVPLLAQVTIGSSWSADELTRLFYAGFALGGTWFYNRKLACDTSRATAAKAIACSLLGMGALTLALVAFELSSALSIPDIVFFAVLGVVIWRLVKA